MIGSCPDHDHGPIMATRDAAWINVQIVRLAEHGPPRSGRDRVAIFWLTRARKSVCTDYDWFVSSLRETQSGERVSPSAA